METSYSIGVNFQNGFELMNYITAFLVFVVLSATYALAAMSLEKKLREKNIELEAISRIDPLTGLSNRRDILDKIVLERGKIARCPSPCCIILSDIDFFKKINDSYGHDFGDFVLEELSRLFKSSLRIQDHVCRWGGEEFLLVLPDTETSGAVIVAEKIRSLVSGHTFTLNSISISLTMTFGVAEYDPKIEIEESIKRADQLLYQGKNKGRNRVEYKEAEGKLK